jgi:quercetin dioxygenase-like cupin family protein
MDMHTQKPIIWAAGEGDRRSFAGGGVHVWKLKAEDTDGAFFMFEDTMTKGKTTPLHAHPEADETTYVLEGEILVKTDGKDTLVGAGGLVFTPKGTPHAFVVVSETARLLSLQTPGVGQSFYYNASDAAASDDDDILDIPRLQATAQDNPRAINMLGPPPFEAASIS